MAIIEGNHYSNYLSEHFNYLQYAYYKCEYSDISNLTTEQIYKKVLSEIQWFDVWQYTLLYVMYMYTYTTYSGSHA